jgi:PAS domain S-box-containing protein
LTAAFALLFVNAGGSFRVARVWLDALTMIAVQLVGLWAFFLGPSVANGTGRAITWEATLAYSITLTSMMSMAALLCLQLPGFRGRIAVMLLVGAAAADVAWEIMWMASWITDRDFVGPFFNFGDVLCFAAVGASAAAMQLPAAEPSESVNPERRADTFLPALAVLVAIALVAGSVATTRRWDAWILVGLVALCALLLITRQISVRKELRALYRQLAKRDADARITELVRSSTDLIMVVNADWIVSFASPATLSMLGIPAAQVQGARAMDLFGPAYSTVLANFLERLLEHPATPSTIELRVRRIGAPPCVIRINAVNQLANQLINGSVLTLTDITEQRMLEREVLDVAARERIRLSADIHDGLGQELVGISMLLHGAAAVPDPDPAVQKSQLQTIVGHVNRTVGTARDLARGLSPLHVVRGSLSDALRRLAPEWKSSAVVRLEIDAAFDARLIDDFSADHIYRIAQEAVNNALRHSGCTHIEVALRRTEAAILLLVTDDGRGFAKRAADRPGFGLRLMEYRARILGGTLRVDTPQGLGTQVELMMPFSVQAPDLLEEPVVSAR